MFAKQSRGAALITAIMVIAIVAAISTSLMLREQIDIHRSKLNFDAGQAYRYANIANAWAEVYYANLYFNRPKDAPPPIWPAIMPEQRLANGTVVTASLDSAQGRFNINNLSNPSYIHLFASLISYTNPGFSQAQSQRLAQAVSQWIKPSNKKSTGNKLGQAILPPNKPSKGGKLLVTPSELLLIPVITPKLYDSLAPYLVALPEVTPVDPNAASKAVFIAMGFASDIAERLIDYRNSNNGFANMSTFEQQANYRPAKTQGTQAIKLFDLQSHYFLIESQITFAKIRLTNYAILRANKENTLLQILQQTQNTL